MPNEGYTIITWTSTSTTYPSPTSISNEDGLWTMVDGVWCLNGVPYDGQNPATKSEWASCPWKPKRR